MKEQRLREIYLVVDATHHRQTHSSYEVQTSCSWRSLRLATPAAVRTCNSEFHFLATHLFPLSNLYNIVFVLPLQKRMQHRKIGRTSLSNLLTATNYPLHTACA